MAASLARRFSMCSVYSMECGLIIQYLQVLQSAWLRSSRCERGNVWKTLIEQISANSVQTIDAKFASYLSKQIEFRSSARIRSESNAMQSTAHAGVGAQESDFARGIRIWITFTFRFNFIMINCINVCVCRYNCWKRMHSNGNEYSVLANELAHSHQRPQTRMPQN